MVFSLKQSAKDFIGYDEQVASAASSTHSLKNLTRDLDKKVSLKNKKQEIFSVEFKRFCNFF